MLTPLLLLLLMLLLARRQAWQAEGCQAHCFGVGATLAALQCELALRGSLWLCQLHQQAEVTGRVGHLSV